MYPISRRTFLRGIGLSGIGVVAAGYAWSGEAKKVTFEKAVGRIAEIEHTLGLADIAQFTPQPPPGLSAGSLRASQDRKKDRTTKFITTEGYRSRHPETNLSITAPLPYGTGIPTA